MKSGSYQILSEAHASAIKRILDLEVKLCEAQEDQARLTYMIEETSALRDGWIEGWVFNSAYPDPEERLLSSIDDDQKAIRALIDKRMKEKK